MGEKVQSIAMDVTVTKNGDGKNEGAVWKQGEDNPDWNLAILNSSNLDYVSNMSQTTGSHLIYSFYRRAMKSFDDGYPIALGQIFHQVQEVLGRTHQLPTYLWNNGTENIELRKNKLKIAHSNHEMLVEMIEPKENAKIELQQSDGKTVQSHKIEIDDELIQITESEHANDNGLDKDLTKVNALCLDLNEQRLERAMNDIDEVDNEGNDIEIEMHMTDNDQIISPGSPQSIQYGVSTKL